MFSNQREKIAYEDTTQSIADCIVLLIKIDIKSNNGIIRRKRSDRVREIKKIYGSACFFLVLDYNL